MFTENVYTCCIPSSTLCTRTAPELCVQADARGKEHLVNDLRTYSPSTSQPAIIPRKDLRAGAASIPYGPSVPLKCRCVRWPCGRRAIPVRLKHGGHTTTRTGRRGLVHQFRTLHVPQTLMSVGGTTRMGHTGKTASLPRERRTEWNGRGEQRSHTYKCVCHRYPRRPHTLDTMCCHLPENLAILTKLTAESTV